MVALPGAAVHMGRDENIALVVLFVRGDKGKAALGRQERAGDITVMGGLGQTVLFVFDDLAAGGQALDAVGKRLFATPGSWRRSSSCRWGRASN